MPVAKLKGGLRAAFVVTTVIAIPGCASPGAASPTCPSARPVRDESCGSVPVVCTYDDDCSGKVTARCEATGKWKVEYEHTCNPPPPPESASSALTQ